MAIIMRFKRISFHRHAIYQARATNQFATCLAFCRMNPSASANSATSDFPIFLFHQNEIEPMLLHHKSILGRSFYSTATSCILFGYPHLYIACVADAATRILVACVADAAARIRVACVADAAARILVATSAALRSAPQKTYCAHFRIRTLHDAAAAFLTFRPAPLTSFVRLKSF